MSAASWYTSSNFRSIAWRQTYGSRRSPIMKSSAWVALKSGNLRSTPRTKKPSFFRRFTRWDPMNPPAPRTRALRMLSPVVMGYRFPTGDDGEVRRGELRLMPSGPSPEGAGPSRIPDGPGRSFRENLVGAREGPGAGDVEDVGIGPDVLGERVERRGQAHDA